MKQSTKICRKTPALTGNNDVTLTLRMSDGISSVPLDEDVGSSALVATKLGSWYICRFNKSLYLIHKRDTYLGV